MQVGDPTVTLFDYLVLFILLTSVIASFFRGLVSEVLSLLGWIAGFIIANTYSGSLAALLPESLPGQTVRLMAAFLILFIGVKLLAALLSRAVNAIVKASGLAVVNRGLGGVFGVARGVLLILTVVILCGMTAIPRQPFWKDAWLSPYAESVVRDLKPHLPDQIAQHVQF